jgi:hypothetical protein
MSASWQLLPQDVVDQSLGRMEALTGGTLPPMTGFLPTDGTHRMMLIGAIREASLTEAGLAKELVGPAAAEQLERSVTQLNGAGIPIELGTMTWDSREHVIWVDGGEQGGGDRPLRALLVYRPVDHWGALMAVVLGENATVAELREMVLPIVRTLRVDAPGVAKTGNGAP